MDLARIVCVGVSPGCGCTVYLVCIGMYKVLLHGLVSLVLLSWFGRSLVVYCN